MKRANLIAGLVLLVGALVMIFWIVPAHTETADEASIQPSVYPSIALWMIAILSATLVVLSVIGMKQSDDTAAAISLANLKNLLLVGAIVGASYVAMDFLGYLYGAIGLVLALMLYMGARNPVTLVLVPVGTALTIWLFFEVLLERPLP